MKLIASSVKTRLLLALGGISGTTVIAAGVACVLFGQFGDSLNQVTGHSVPAMTASLELAAQTQSLAASAPALLAARNDEERTPRLEVLRQALSASSERIERIKRSGGDAAAVDALNAAMAKLTTNVADLDSAVVHRIAIRGAITKKVAELDKAHQGLIQLTTPALEHAKTEISMASMSIGGDTKEMTSPDQAGGATGAGIAGLVRHHVRRQPGLGVAAPRRYRA
jgi:phosphoglycerate-specific signal transduction histidine kinase